MPGGGLGSVCGQSAVVVAELQTSKPPVSPSGAPYHATGLTRDTTVFVPSGGLTETFVNRFHIVGTMGAPTYYVKTTFHITVTPSGDVAVELENFSEECV
jgi:hypothetical protein